MKKHILYSIIILTLGLASCKKFLDENNPNSINLGSYFKSQNDFDLAVNGAYAQLRGIYNNRSAWLMGEMRSDNAHYDYTPTDQAVATFSKWAIADFINDGSNIETPAKWDAAYNAISAANTILDHINDVDLAVTSKNQIIGEAKFIRALSYLELVRYFGGVPIYPRAPLSRNETYIARSSAQEVYDFIIADAKDAAEKLAPPSFPQTGRATRGSALTLLGDVYVTTKKYDLAEAVLKQVTQMNYGLMTTYPDVFQLANKNSKESIFEIQFNTGLSTPQANTGGNVYNYLPRMTSTTIITGVNTNTVTAPGGYNTPTQELISDYESGDQRLDATIAVAEGSFNVNDIFTATAVKSVVGYTAPSGKVGRPFAKKFLHAHTIANQTNDNLPIYRYAEVLLLLAESLNEQGGKSAQALPYLNQVRDRAFGAGKGTISTTDQNALRAIILHERRVELAFENKRWIDLVRTGNAITVMNAFGVSQKQRFSYLQAGTYNITQEKLLFPIPTSEIMLNDKLKQNPGY